MDYFNIEDYFKSCKLQGKFWSTFFFFDFEADLWTFMFKGDQIWSYYSKGKY